MDQEAPATPPTPVANKAQNGMHLHFQFNGHCGTTVVHSPTELKEFLIRPMIHRIPECVLEINEEQTWTAFKDAGFHTAYNVDSSHHLVAWMTCPYKVPLSKSIPPTAEGQNNKYEGKVDRYY